MFNLSLFNSFHVVADSTVKPSLSDHFFRKTTFLFPLKNKFSLKPVLKKPLDKDPLPIKTTLIEASLISLHI